MPLKYKTIYVCGFCGLEVDVPVATAAAMQKTETPPGFHRSDKDQEWYCKPCITHINMTVNPFLAAIVEFHKQRAKEKNYCTHIPAEMLDDYIDNNKLLEEVGQAQQIQRETHEMYLELQTLSVQRLCEKDKQIREMSEQITQLTQTNKEEEKENV